MFTPLRASDQHLFMNRSPGRGWASPRSTAAPSRSGPVGVVYEKCSPSYREWGSTKEGIPMRYKEREASLSPSPWGDPPLIQCAGEGVSSITGEPSSKTQSPCPAWLLLAIALHSPARLSGAGCRGSAAKDVPRGGDPRASEKWFDGLPRMLPENRGEFVSENR